MVKSSTTPKRRRGAPPGDHNPFEYGLYASLNTDLADSEAEPSYLDSHSGIDLIRSSMQRFQGLSKSKTHLDAIDDLSATSISISFADSTLAMSSSTTLNKTSNRPIQRSKLGN
jgi:hypothetical protein